LSTAAANASKAAINASRSRIPEFKPPTKTELEKVA